MDEHWLILLVDADLLSKRLFHVDYEQTFHYSITNAKGNGKELQLLSPY